MDTTAAVLGEMSEIPLQLKLAMMVATYRAPELGIKLLGDRVICFQTREVGFVAIETARVIRAQLPAAAFQSPGAPDGIGVHPRCSVLPRLRAHVEITEPVQRAAFQKCRQPIDIAH